MKQILTTTKRMFFVLAMLVFALNVQAQLPTYKLYVTNEVQTAPNVYKFDVYLLNTSAVTFKLANVAFGLSVNPAIKGAGFIVPSIQANSSQLDNSAQWPTAVNYVNTANYFNCAAKPNPGNALASTISAINGGCSSPGTRVATFVVTNQVSATDATAVPFASNSQSNSIFSTSVGSGRTNTVVSAYDQTAPNNPFAITVAANNLALSGVATCYQNITLNFICPTITVSPASGALAGGTIGTPYAGATVSATGGTAPYAYTVTAGALPAGLTLNPTTGAISGTPTGPAANASFTVTATASGVGSCTGTAAYTINVVNGCNVSGSGTTTAVSCFGSTDGTATVTLTGTGSAALPGTYTVDGNPGGAYSTNPFTVTGLSAGSHTIVATTGSGCVSTGIVVNVGNTAVLTGSAGSITPVSCSTLGTAQITLSASTAGTYTVDGNPGGSYNANPFTVIGLSAGSHTVVATSAAGCVSSDITFNVGSSSALAGTGTTTPVTCGGGGNNGTATITLTGGSTQAPGTYTLDSGSPVSYTTNPFTITGLSSGNHSIVVTAGGCTTAPILVNVGAPATFTATYVKTNLSACSGTPDGTITVTPAGGSGNYSYSWTGTTGSGNPATTPFTAGNVSSLSGLNYGYYNVTITDVGGCGVVTINNIHVEFAFTVVVSNSGTSANACGGSTGSITLYGNAGVLPYTYSLSATGPFVASNTFTGLAAGSYTGYVKDAGGCVGSKSITVSSAPAIAVSPFVRNASTCSPDGSIEVYRTGGTPPYTYSKDGGTTYQASYIFSGLAAGSYAIVVKDAAGCTGTANAVVGAGVGLTATTSKVNTSTCVNDGSIQVNPAGGTAPYTYSKDGGTTYQASNSFAGLGAGNYTIKVKDSKGCTSGDINVTINLNTIVVTASVVNATTCSSNNGQVQLFRTGGYGPYTYSLDGNTYQSSTIFTNVPAGTYTGYVKDSKTCIGTLSNIVVGPTNCVPGIVATKSNAKVLPGTTAELKIQAYPNPSTAEFTLVLQGYDSKVKVSVTITDVLGRKVYQTEGTGVQQYKFGKGFIAGIYSVQVIQGNEKKSVKLVKE